MPAYNDKNKKKNPWYCKFYYTDWKGERKQKLQRGFRTQGDAKKFEAEFLSKANADCDMLFEHLYDIYMEDCATRLKPTTLENKRVLIELKILPYFKGNQLNKIEPNMVRRWQNELISKGYADTYLKTIHNQLTAMFNYAMKFYKLQDNPARKCGSMGKKNANSMQIWTVDEFNKFIPSLDHKPLSKMAFEVLFWTGCRSGELLALTVKDIDLENNTININKNYAVVKGEEMILEPKTPKSKRIVPIPDFLAEGLKEYLSKLYDLGPKDRIFSATKSLLNLEMIRGCKVSEVKKIRVHDLRHSHASLLIELGFSPLLIAERLGHEKIQTTLETYSHLYPNKQVEVVQKLDELVSH